MQIRTAISNSLVLGGYVVFYVSLAVCQLEDRITGTYTNMHYNHEGGDVLGEELRIAYTSKGYEGTLQFAQGVPGELILVEITQKGKKIAFDIPPKHPEEGSFNGTIERDTLEGQFMFKSGGTQNVQLKKGKSCWD